MTDANNTAIAQTVIAANLEGMAMLLNGMAQQAQEASDAMKRGERNLAIGTVLGFENRIPEIEALFKTAMMMHRNAV